MISLLSARSTLRRTLPFALPIATIMALAWQQPASARPVQTEADATKAGQPDGSPVSDERPDSTEPKATGNWGGARSRLEEQGVALGGSLILEGFSNLRGGYERKTVGATTFDTNVTFDLAKLFGLNDGEVYVDFENHAGRDPDEVIGDLQVTDKYNSTPYTQIFEFWYQQKLFDDQLRIKIGKIDANTEFSVIDNGLEFLSASTQVTPTLLNFTTTPDPSPAIDVFFTPKNSIFYAAASVADANRHDRFLDFAGSPSEIIQATDDGVLLIGEAGLVWDRLAGHAGNGNVRFGVWRHTGTFERFDGRPQHGASGFYAIYDQTLWRPTAEAKEQRGIGAFLEYGSTDGAVATIDRHYGGGLAWTGPSASRPADVAGVSAERAHLSRDAGLRDSEEWLIESFYKLQLTDWTALQPDLQYVVNTGGEYGDALVGILSAKIEL